MTSRSSLTAPAALVLRGQHLPAVRDSSVVRSVFSIRVLSVAFFLDVIFLSEFVAECFPSALVSSADSSAVLIMWGVMKIMRLVFSTLVVLNLKSQPRTGMSPRNGTFDGRGRDIVTDQAADHHGLAVLYHNRRARGTFAGCGACLIRGWRSRSHQRSPD